MGEANTPQESWNMAQATLKRLSNLLDQSSLASQTNNLIMWFNVLMDLRRNLYPFLEKKDFDDVETKLKSLPKGWIIPGNRVHPSHFSSVHKIFDESYLIFIKCMKEKGLLMPKPIDTSKSIMEM